MLNILNVKSPAWLFDKFVALPRIFLEKMI